MQARRGIVVTLTALALGTLTSCGSKGLPPAGPGEGEVAVGYDSQDEDKVTGAVTTVTSDDIGSTRPASLEELLRGRVAGLQIVRRPDGTVSFRIRGVGSMQEQPEPLFVVDGVKMSGNDLESALAGLTREDIRQVDVLKDVASTSIYGIRGAGGVVVITTTRR